MIDAPKRFSASYVLTASLLIGFIGFGIGYNYPRIENFVSSRWFSRPKQNLPEDLNYADVETVYDSLRSNFAGELTADKLLEGAKRGLVQASGDPYTAYLSAEEAKQLQQDLEGTFTGIGAEIAIKDQRLVVVAPLSNSPAEKAGLKAGDHILSIEGESTESMSVETAVSKIRGPEGSQVKINIVRGNQPPQELAIARAKIEVPAVTGQIKAAGVGYMELARFGKDTRGKLVEIANQLKAQGATKFILDLRNNPGGLLDAAIDTSDEFLDVGKTIVEERKDGTVLKTFRSSSGGVLLNTPVVVLVNKGSASASEIVAGALKDNNIASIVGETSFGKGSVQELIELNAGTYLKVTIARWFTPGGRNISDEGIEPDTKVDLSSDDFNQNRDPQLDRAIQILTNS